MNKDIDKCNKYIKNINDNNILEIKSFLLYLNNKYKEDIDKLIFLKKISNNIYFDKDINDKTLINIYLISYYKILNIIKEGSK